MAEKITIAKALNMALDQEMKRDDAVLVMGEDVGVDGGVFRITDGLIDKYGKERVIDSPLAEAAIVGTGIGMALNGLRPVLEMQFSGFIYPAFQEIVSHAARLRNRTRGKYNVPLVIRTPCSGGVRALEHHQESTEAFFIHTPGLKVVMPSNPYDAKGLMAASIRDNDPVIFFEPLKLYRSVKGDVPDEEYTIPIGKANIVREGTDLTIVTYGTMVKPSVNAAENIKEKYNIEVIDLRTLSPWDKKTVLKSVEKTSRCMVVHEAPRTLGMGAEISASVTENLMLSLQAPVKRVTGFDTIIPLAKLEHYFIPDEKRITEGIEETMNF